MDHDGVGAATGHFWSNSEKERERKRCSLTATDSGRGGRWCRCFDLKDDLGLSSSVCEGYLLMCSVVWESGGRVKGKRRHQLFFIDSDTVSCLILCDRPRSRLYKAEGEEGGGGVLPRLSKVNYLAIGTYLVEVDHPSSGCIMPRWIPAGEGGCKRGPPCVCVPVSHNARQEDLDRAAK